MNRSKKTKKQYGQNKRKQVFTREEGTNFKDEETFFHFLEAQAVEPALRRSVKSSSLLRSPPPAPKDITEVEREREREFESEWSEEREIARERETTDVLVWRAKKTFPFFFALLPFLCR